ncbi:hypothetical protein [Jiulongibacter sp. NS-SX5]|uniref:hypothetical protein n=1 Tax=Jiulongibacter sp. NS-SX5 TaxID=3463854 RepID=UPI004058A556
MGRFTSEVDLELSQRNESFELIYLLQYHSKKNRRWRDEFVFETISMYSGLFVNYKV